MKKTLLTFAIGLACGILISRLVFTSYFSKPKYIETLENYNIENLGVLKKGVKLRVDEGMSEGFTRYILYLNLKGGNFVPITNEKIIPYWLYQIDTAKH